MREKDFPFLQIILKLKFDLALRIQELSCCIFVCQMSLATTETKNRSFSLGGLKLRRWGKAWPSQVENLRQFLKAVLPAYQILELSFFGKEGNTKMYLFIFSFAMLYLLDFKYDRSPWSSWTEQPKQKLKTHRRFLVEQGDDLRMCWTSCSIHCHNAQLPLL